MENPAGQVAAPFDQTHHRPENGGGGFGQHSIPSAHEMAASDRPQAIPSVAHVGGESVATPPAGEHAPTLAWSACCSKDAPPLPGNDVHAPATGTETADPRQVLCV